jgi:hypothetical protein
MDHFTLVDNGINTPLSTGIGGIKFFFPGITLSLILALLIFALSERFTFFARIPLRKETVK